MRSALTIVGGAIVTGVFAACIRAVGYIGANRYQDVGAYRLSAISIRDELNLALWVIVVSAMVAVGMLELHSVLRRTFRPLFRATEKTAGFRAVGVEAAASLVTIAVAGICVNKFLLGDALSTSSLLADAGMIALPILASAAFFYPNRAVRIRSAFRDRRLIRAVGAVLLVAIGVVNVAVAIHGRMIRPKTPNVVFILVDTLRRDHVGTYGYDRGTTPNIDALAEESMVFTSCLAQAPSTKPSVASIFTSRFPSEHGAIDNFAQLSFGEFTMAELFLEAGYSTAAFVENPVIRTSFQYDQGFEYWHEDLARVFPGDDAMVDFDKKLVDWIERSQDEPFFLYVHYLDPHCPYEAPAPFFEARTVLGEPFGSVETATLTPQFYSKRPEKLAAAIARYDEEIRFVDARIGALMETFRTLQLMDDLILVFVSDHGEGFLEHGQMQHSYGVYSELIDVPLVIKNGSSAEKGRSDQMVQHIDLLPTIMDAAGISADYVEPRGRSILDVGATDTQRDFIIEYLRISLGRPQRALVNVPWKIIHNLVDDSYELYNVVDDPMERQDVSSVEPEVVKALKAELSTWVEQRGMSNSDVGIVPDEENTELMEALGYL